MANLPKAPSLRLDGRRALVTGAGRGIGRAAAAALAQYGAQVTVASRTFAEVDALARDIRADGGQADALALDVLDIAKFRSEIEGRDPYHILVNNAGGNRPKAFLEVTEEDYDAVIDLNVRAAFFVSQTLARMMQASQMRGSIIHMSSQMGHVGAAQRSIYCASKWAIEGLTKAMAVELAPFGIRVNAIAPTFIETPLTKPFFIDEAFRSNVLSKIKLGRIGTVEDLMGAIVFLASDQSALMTGASMLIDGGWTAD